MPPSRRRCAPSSHTDAASVRAGVPLILNRRDVGAARFSVPSTLGPGRRVTVAARSEASEMSSARAQLVATEGVVTGRSARAMPSGRSPSRTWVPAPATSASSARLASLRSTSTSRSRSIALGTRPAGRVAAIMRDIVRTAILARKSPHWAQPTSGPNHRKVYSKGSIWPVSRSQPKGRAWRKQRHADPRPPQGKGLEVRSSNLPRATDHEQGWNPRDRRSSSTCSSTAPIEEIGACRGDVAGVDDSPADLRSRR